MNIKIRSWRIDDAKSLAQAINNKKVQDNLRDGIPFPYTISDAKDFISAMFAANINNTFAWAITVDDIAVGTIANIQIIKYIILDCTKKALIMNRESRSLKNL